MSLYSDFLGPVQDQTLQFNDIQLPELQSCGVPQEQTPLAPYPTQVEEGNTPVHDPLQRLVQCQTSQLNDFQLPEPQLYIEQQGQTPLAPYPTQVEDSTPVHDPLRWFVQYQTFQPNDIQLPEPQPYIRQQEQAPLASHPTQVGDDTPVDDPWQWLVHHQTSQLNDVQLPEPQPYIGQQEQTFLPPHPTQAEGDNAPVHDPPKLPTDTPPACPICRRTFARKQERNRHLRTYLPHCIYCHFPRCSWRCDRHDNLRKHWQKQHADSGPAPQKHECEIYDPDSFVESVNCGRMSIELAAETALISVKSRAIFEDKQDLWEKNWSGRLQHRAAARTLKDKDLR